MSGSSAILGSSRGVSDGLAKLSFLGLVVGLVAGIAQIAAGPGRQFGLWDHNFGFKILEWAAYAGLAAAGASLIGVFFAWGIGLRRLIVIGLVGTVIRVVVAYWPWTAYIGLAVAGVSLVCMFFAWGVGQRQLVVFGLIGTAIGGLVAYWPWALQRAFREPPPLYDITTDTANPPRFVAALDLRKAASRLPSEYPANFASQQQKAYPDIRPAMLRMPDNEAFAFALRLARATRGWTVHTAVPSEGRIEAVAKTLWFGFEDDVVIRVVATDGGTRVDVRSTGRLGRRDGGMNAKRVQAFLKKLNAAN